MSVSIREKQIEVLKHMLNFNQSISDKTNLNEPSWKILVYDKYGQDIISPLLGVKELRDNGVTINLLLHSDRDQITDVPAIYFIAPTTENISRLCQDLKDELYESYYLNFISPIPRSLLEDIAQTAIEANCVSQIQRVYDQYLNFISLEDELFILRHQNRDPISYYALNKGDVKDTEMEQIVNTIVDSLFSVFVTLGTVPIIRCPKNTAAEYVSEKLDKKLRENLRDARNSLFVSDNISPSQLNFQRPLLLIVDRNFDLATPLHHTWTYQALIHDTLDLSLNRVEIIESNKDANQKKKQYDLLNIDKFWKNQKGSPFPSVAETITEELDKCKQNEDNLRNLKGTEVAFDESLGLLDKTNRLTSAVNSLPEFLEQKRLLDMHTNIASSLLDQIKKRKLDIYFETEEKIMSKTNLEKSIMEIINDPDAGTIEDKIRLLIIYYICSPNVNQVELEQYISQLQSIQNKSIDSIKYIKRYKSISKMNSNQYSDSGTNTINMFSNLLSKSSKFVMDGVKNFVVKQHKLPLTKIVDNLMELKTSSDNDDYRYFDPKLIRNEGSNTPRTKTSFNEALVFIIGGGNYIEYQNLMDYAKARSTNSAQKKLIYGSTALVNASMLIKELTLLGEQIG